MIYNLKKYLMKY